MEKKEFEELLKEYERRKYSHITTISVLAVVCISAQVALAAILVLFLR